MYACFSRFNRIMSCFRIINNMCVCVFPPGLIVVSVLVVLFSKSISSMFVCLSLGLLVLCVFVFFLLDC